MNRDALLVAARAWLAGDPDPETAAQTRALLDSADTAVLADHFGSRLEFGTAGIRGQLGSGPGRMNRALVRRVSAGLGRYLLARGLAGQAVVVGFDARHKSDVFAADTAQVLAAMGVAVWLHDSHCATPELAFAVRHLGAAAGVMVTASHNPPQDNGYKVYWGNGAQIIPPHDRGISDEIDKITGPPPLSDEGVRAVPPTVARAYEAAVLGLRVHPSGPVRAVYTAMHGVGYAPLRRVLARAGHAAVIPVPEQVEPDPDFPTVAFPNPEEPGALDLALALARDAQADVVIANDPDADRLAMAIPDPSTPGGFRVLTGNQLGLLLADDLLAHGPAAPGRLVATTIVSTALLQRVARAHGAQAVEVLTGFKWLANAALQHDGPFVLGFEEALGYSVGTVVRDKDGVSAALIALDLVGWCKGRGLSLMAHLEDLYRRVGFSMTAQSSLNIPGSDGALRMQGLMDRLRADSPTSIGGVAVVQVRDVLTGLARSGAETRALDLPRSNVLAFDLEDGSRVLARPSGTEPKIKFYFEAVDALGPDEPLAGAEARVGARLAAMRADLVGRLGLE